MTSDPNPVPAASAGMPSPEYSAGAHHEIEIAGGIARLRITHAGKLNIVSSPVLNDVVPAIERLAKRDDVRVLVLGGRGDTAFVGGADINEMATLDPAGAERFISRLRALCDALRAFPAPVIARIAGWCLGGGLEVALSCDLRVSASNAHFGMPEVRIGIPSVIHAALMPRLIGQARAAWLLLSAETIDADQAERWGLVQKLCAADLLDHEIDLLASTLAGFGPAVLRQQKALLRAWEDTPLDTAIDATVKAFGQAYATGEPQHFMGEFLRAKKRR